MKTKLNLTSAWKIGLVIFVLALFQGTSPGLQRVSADFAPPPPPVGSDLSPSIANTKVKMVSEYVLIDIPVNSPYPSGQANVTAQFLFHNVGDAEEQMRVRFPMNHSGYDLAYELKNREEFCGYSQFPSLNEIKVWVNEQQVEVDITYKKMIDNLALPPENGDPIYITVPCWAHFDVAFPPNQDVSIKASYTVAGYITSPKDGWVEFSYVLGTGIGWYDTIGKGDIVARLPYTISSLNLMRCDPGSCTLSNKEISWHFEDFEPEGNVTIEIIRPAIWQRVITEQNLVLDHPNNGEAWGRLGKAYKESISSLKGYFLSTPPGPEIYELSKDAYQKAVDLLPNDADWHYGFADLLCRYAEWNKNTTENWFLCIEQLQQALELDPTHEQANELVQHIDALHKLGWLKGKFVDLSGSQPDFLLLTSVPTNTPIDTPFAVQSTPTRTEIVETSTPSFTPTQATIESATAILAQPTKDRVVIANTSTVSESVSGYSNSTIVIYFGLTLLIIIIVAVVVNWRSGSRG